MEDNRKVVGITLGPIGDTISLAKNPPMLWYSSAVFSRLAFTICKNIKCGVQIDGVKYEISNPEILVPYVSNDINEKSKASPDGIGKYHDRIIFKADNVDNIGKIIEESKKEIANMIAEDMHNSGGDLDNCVQFMCKYFQVPYVILDSIDDNVNVILGTSHYLDLLEQMRCFNPDNSNNPIVKLFATNKEGNMLIKKSTMQPEFETDMANLLKKVNDKVVFRDIEDITGKKQHQGKEKPLKYYAVIQADGDKMGKYLEGIPEDHDVHAFSKNCITYAGEIAKVIKDYGGMTVYAGGDDLLAIVPVLANGTTDIEFKNVFELCNKINKVFKENVAGNTDLPSVSIGVAIRYIKFPLYEALSAAISALYDAKAVDETKKNYVAVDFQKHSGQGIKLSIPMEKTGFVSQILKGESNVETVNSIIYILDTFKAMFYKEENETPEELKNKIANIFENLYDNASQKKYLDYINILADNLADMMNTTERKIAVYGVKNKDKTDLKAFEGILRIKKFITEEVYND